MKRSNLLSKLFLATFLIFSTLSLQAQTYWIGGTGDWHEASNWDTGQIPNSGDLVIIKEGDVIVLSGNFGSALSVIIGNNCSLSIEGNAGLSILDGYDGVGILNKGVLNIDGSLRISSITDSGAKCILNEGDLLNNGAIDIRGEDVAQGIDNNRNIENEGDITITNCGVWCITNGGSLENNGLIDIFNTDDHGLLSSGDSNIRNEGELKIDCRSQGLFNYGSLYNASGALIEISNDLGEGLAALFVGEGSGSASPGNFENRGFINLDGGQTNIYHNSGSFNNRGKIIGTRSSSTALRIQTSAAFRNYTQMQLSAGDGNGINNGGLFVNRRNANVILTDFDETHIENSSAGEFRNFGLLHLDNSGQRNIDNEGIFNNNGHGNLAINNEVFTHDGSTFNNWGHIYNQFNGSNTIANNTFTNHAVLGDKTESFTNITNNGIHLIPIGPGVTVGQAFPNALGLGSVSGLTVGNWGTILNWQSMGAYNSSANTFTPNSNAIGVTELIVQVRINAVNKTGYHRVPVIGGIQSPGPNLFEGEFLNSKLEPAAIQMFPNPVMENLNIKIPQHLGVGKCTVEILSTNGRVLKREKFEDLTAFTIPVNDLTPGLYAIRISTGSNEIVKKFVKN